MERDFISRVVNQFNSKVQNPLDTRHLNNIFNTSVRNALLAYPIFVDFPGKSQIYPLYRKGLENRWIQPSLILESILKTCVNRSWSGVNPISFSLDGTDFTCAYDCSFCPNECRSNGAKADIARSYLSNEGSFTRGAIEGFSTYRQIWRRLAELESMGHTIDKLEFIPLGGTWGCIDNERRKRYIHELFYAANTYFIIQTTPILQEYFREWLKTQPFKNNLPFDKRITQFILFNRPIDSFESEKRINTDLPSCRVIGIVLETRPDKINRFTLQELRIQGCTRIQMGIQHINDEILERNNRKHDVATTVKAIRYAKDAAFKVDGHLMPDLPFTTLEDDYQMVQRVFLGEDMQLDYCKIYPCLDLPFTQIRKWKEAGIWKPIAENDFESFMNFLCYTLSIVPPWVRVNRVQRDFLEATERNGGLGFVSQNIRTNLQQMVTERMTALGMRQRDIRSREIRNLLIDPVTSKLYIRNYRASDATEYFISVENPLSDQKDDAQLLGLCRLRIPDEAWRDQRHWVHPFRDRDLKYALIRELHVYGMVTNDTTTGNVQHRGIGKFLMHVAEAIAQMHQCHRIAVISGVGVRGYYQSLGYKMTDEKNGEYMIKNVERIFYLKLFEKYYLLDEIKEAIKTTAVFGNEKAFKTGGRIQKYNYPEIQDGRPEAIVVTGIESGHLKIGMVVFAVILIMMLMMFL